MNVEGRNSTASCRLSRKTVEPHLETYVKMLLVSRSTTFLTTTTCKDARISRYERREVGKNMKYNTCLENKEKNPWIRKKWKQSHGKRLEKGMNLASGPTRHVSRFHGATFDRFNFVLSDSDSGKIYVIPKCFRDTDTTAKSVSSNSSSKNLDTAIYTNSGKLKILKISNLIFNASWP